MAKRSDKEENNDTDEDIDIQEEVNEKEEENEYANDLVTSCQEIHIRLGMIHQSRSKVALSQIQNEHRF